MYKTTVQIGGRMCGMCESHLNQAIRSSLPVRKVTSSHKKGKMEIESDQPLKEDDVCRIITSNGYDFGGMTSAQMEKKRRFF